jgi:hypothetical protein
MPMRIALSLSMLISLGLATPLDAQLLRGRVSDAVTGDPVFAASVAVLNADSTVVATARTDRGGEFVLRPAAGTFLLYVDRVGYEATMTAPRELGIADSLTFELRIPPRAVDIAGLEVVAPRRNEMDPSGFFQRKREGWGKFIEPAEIDRRNPTSVADILRSVPGLWFVPTPGGYRVRMESRGRHCSPTVYVDRAIAAQGSSTPGGFVGGARNSQSGVAIDQLINTRLVRAVEVYQSAAEAPLGLHPRGGPGGGDCGVIVLWTYAGFGG